MGYPKDIATHDVFPPKGFWEVTWLGPLSYRRGQGQYSIEVVLMERFPSPIDPREPAIKYTGRTAVKSCGIGEAVNLHIGAIARDQKILPRSVVERARRRYHSDIIFEDVIRNKGDWEAVLDGGISQSVRPPDDVGLFRDTPCVVLYSRKTGKRIWVPHIELIRALFSGSAAFLKSVMHGTLCRDHRPNEAIFDIKNSRVDESNPRRVLIFAGRKLLPEEAKLAALLHGHPELWKAAKSVSDSFRSRGLVPGTPIFAKAVWPDFNVNSIHGTVRTLPFGLGERQGNNEGNSERATVRRVLAHIKNVTIPPPYDDVVVLYPVHGAAPGGRSMQRFHLKEVKPDEIRIQNQTDPSLSLGGKVLVESETLGENMDFLSSMNVEYIGCFKKTGPVVVVVPQPNCEKMVGSTADPGFGGDEVAVVDFVPPEDDSLLTNPQVCSRLHAAADALRILANEFGGVAYEVIRQGKQPLVVPPRCVTFPVDWNGGDLPWSIYDDIHGWVRRAFIGLLVVNDRIVYFFDAEIDREDADAPSDKAPESSVLFLFRPHTDIELECGQIDDMLGKLSKRRGVWPKAGFEHGTSDRVVHSDERLNANNLAQIIKERLKGLGVT
jgi:hypothetical protein